MEHFLDTIALAEEPQALAARVLETCEELAHVADAAPRILYLASQRVLWLHGGQKAAVIVQPRWQGPLGMVAEVLIAHLAAGQFEASLDPDYVVIVDAAVWSSLDDIGRERLMFHELSHLQQPEDEFGVPRIHKETGRPLLKLMPHDVELFESEVRRYGVEVCNADGFVRAVVDGEANLKRKGFRVVA